MSNDIIINDELQACILYFYILCLGGIVLYWVSWVLNNQNNQLTWQVFPNIRKGDGPGGLSFTNTVCLRTLCPNWHINLSWTRAQSLLGLKHAIATTATKRLKTWTTLRTTQAIAFSSPLELLTADCQTPLLLCCQPTFKIIMSRNHWRIVCTYS